MITRQEFPFVKYEGRLFRAERYESTIIIQFLRGSTVSTELNIPVKNLFELKMLVDDMYKNELKDLYEKEETKNQGDGSGLDDAGAGC